MTTDTPLTDESVRFLAAQLRGDADEGRYVLEMLAKDARTLERRAAMADELAAALREITDNYCGNSRQIWSR